MTIPKKWIVAALVLGLVGVADAKKKKNNDNGGIKGKIVSVSANSITIKSGGKKAAGGAQQMTIHIGPATTVEINGESTKRVTQLQTGERVVVLEDQNGVATDIQAKSKKKGGKRRAK